MKNNCKFSKFAWLLLIAAFAVTAAGGCGGGGGSSSNDGGDDEDVVVGNVTELDRSEHPLAEHLRELYHEMPKGTIFLSEKLRGVSFPDMKAKLRAAYEEGKIIGMFAPTRARIEELHEVLGIDIFREQTEAELAAGDEDEIEFYMIKQHDGLIFLNRQHYVGKGTSGAEFYQVGPIEILDDGAISGDETEVTVEPIGDKREAYPQIAAAIASWNGSVAERAAKVKAESESARDAIRAAAGSDILMDLTRPIISTSNFTFPDKDTDEGRWISSPYGRRQWVPLYDPTSTSNPDCRYKFPTIDITATMYSCYSFQQDVNYYLVVMNSSMNNEKNYHHWTWWGPTPPASDGNHADYEQNATHSYYSMPEMKSVSKKSNVQLLEHQPLNYFNGYSGSNGINYVVGGSIGFTSEGQSGPVNLGVPGGIAFGRSKRFTIKDYEVIDHTNGEAPWTEYVLESPGQDTHVMSPADLHEASEASKNFSSEEFWIWRVARSEKDAYSFEHNFSYKLLMERGSVSSHGLHQWYIHAGQGYAIDLPIPPTLALSDAEMTVAPNGSLDGGRPVKFDLFSDGEWELSCDADWVKIDDGDKRGGRTQQRTIYVTVMPTSMPEVRRATITATGTNDPNGKPQTAKLVITQEPDLTKQWTIVIDPASMTSDGITADCMGGEYQFSLLSENDWAASCDADWVHLDKTWGPATVSRAAWLFITIDENKGEARQAEIIVRDKTDPNGQYRTVKIVQAEPLLEVDCTALEFGYNPEPQTIHVLANADWHVSTNADWIYFDRSGGGATGGKPSPINVVAPMNVGDFRQGNIVVSDASGNAKAVKVSQKAPQLKVSPTSIKADRNGGQFKISLTANLDWTASVSWGDWCRLSATSGIGSVFTKDLIVYIDKNEHGGRTCDIIVRDENGREVTISIHQATK